MSKIGPFILPPQITIAGLIYKVNNYKMNKWNVYFTAQILVPGDTGTLVLDNTSRTPDIRPFLCSSIMSFWVTLHVALS